MTKIAASILSADLSNLEAEIKALENAGADMIHIDVMDGHFVPNITLGPVIVSSLRPTTKLPLDCHLMITHPERYINDFVKAGADIITVHYEAAVHLHRVVEQIKSGGVRAGVSLNPATPLYVLEEILPYLDLVLLMSVNPGFGGQSYIATSTRKIRRLRQMIDESGSKAELEVDGGVKVDNIAVVVSAGADVVVAGSAVYNEKESVATAIANLRQAASKKTPALNSNGQ